MSSQGRLFCYGTLQLDEVFQRVCGAKRLSRPALLENHASYVMQGENYPGLHYEEGQQVNGCLYHGIDSNMWRKLDRFEGQEYTRKIVTVTLPVTGRIVRAQVYMLKPAFRAKLSRRAWSKQQFRRKHLSQFLQAHCQ